MNRVLATERKDIKLPQVLGPTEALCVVVGSAAGYGSVTLATAASGGRGRGKGVRGGVTAADSFGYRPDGFPYGGADRVGYGACVPE